jgi:hypothetical protein
MATAADGPQGTAAAVAIIAEHPAPPVVLGEADAERRGPQKKLKFYLRSPAPAAPPLPSVA